MSCFLDVTYATLEMTDNMSFDLRFFGVLQNRCVKYIRGDEKPKGFILGLTVR